MRGTPAWVGARQRGRKAKGERDPYKRYRFAPDDPVAFLERLRILTAIDPAADPTQDPDLWRS